MITENKNYRLKMNRKTKGYPLYFILIISIICWILFVSSFSSSMGINNINSFNEIDINDDIKSTRSNGQNDTSGPTISAVNITPVQPKKDEEIQITCTVTDDTDIAYVKIYYCTVDFCTMQILMEKTGDNKYRYNCAPNSLPTGIVECHIIAKDAVNNTTEYNSTFEIRDTLNNLENGDRDNGFIPGFDVFSIIPVLLILTIILYYQKKRSNKK